MSSNLIQHHPYLGMFHIAKKISEEFQNEHLTNTTQEKKIIHPYRVNRNDRRRSSSKKSNTSWGLMIFVLIFLILMFFLVTNILGLYHAVKCQNTIWIVLNIIGLFTGIPFGTIYYFFIRCVTLT